MFDFKNNSGTDVLLKVKDLTLNFYTDEGVAKVLDEMTFSIKHRESFGLVGETGCGKSVTAFSILRLLPSSARIIKGEVWFENINLLHLSEKEMNAIRGKQIAMIFQEPRTSLNPIQTVGDQISEVFRIHRGLSKNEARKEVIRILESLGMPDPFRIMKRYPHQLSGGMCQRVLIAMAIACRPKLLIADEPTTALDATIQAQILDLIKQLKDEMGISLLLISHNFGIVAALCERVGVMYAGTLVESAHAKEIFEKPLHPYTRGLLEAVPELREGVENLKVIPGFIPNPINPPRGCRFHTRCEYVMEICRRQKPPMVRINENHFIACHLYG